MMLPISYSVAAQKLWLSPMKAIFWEDTKSLILSDLHFGKTGHFRKAGIAVPQHIYRNDLQRLFDLVQYFQPKKLIIVGDFFHSETNKEAELFAKWRKDHNHLAIELIKGNHDIFSDEWYVQHEIGHHETHYQEGPFCFIHESPHVLPRDETIYYFSGHIHPGVRIHGAGRQSLRLPCFYFDRQYAILPAFSEFTGLAIIEPSRNSRVFVIANQEILSLQ